MKRVRLGRRVFKIIPVDRVSMKAANEYATRGHDTPWGLMEYFRRKIYYRYDVGKFWDKVNTIIHEIVHVAFQNLRLSRKLRISQENEEAFCEEISNLIVCWLRQWGWYKKKDIR